tara:strand:+ start:2549 stop:3394 length:846 start_codon:yes stop_codon:yes gene_type:complete
LFFAFITLIIAISISAVAAYYSIIGLVAIFSSAVLPVAIMGIVLEAGKLITASWLYQNWKRTNFVIKTYLTFAVVVLMFITSMGIFGFLSKAHIDQTLTSDTSNIEIERIESLITIENRRIENAQKNLDNLERLVENLSAEDAAYTRRIQRRERSAIDETIKEASQKISNYKEEIIPYKKEAVKLEAEVGPIKYISELIYDNSNSELLEDAVRVVIIILVFVFDPLAVVLLIAANMSFQQEKLRRKRKRQAQIKKELPQKKKGEMVKVTRELNGVSTTTYE